MGFELQFKTQRPDNFAVRSIAIWRCDVTFTHTYIHTHTHARARAIYLQPHVHTGMRPSRDYCNYL